jgi:hypothetical protein
LILRGGALTGLSTSDVSYSELISAHPTWLCESEVGKVGMKMKMEGVDVMLLVVGGRVRSDASGGGAEPNLRDAG